MTDRQSFGVGIAECCSAFASTAPEALPQTQPWHHTADRFLAATRPSIVPLLAGLALVASAIGDHVANAPALVVFAAYAAVAGAWCDLNFVRRHESHCLVTGLGWTGLALAALVAAAVEPATIGWFWPAFEAVLVAAVAFGLGWGLLTGDTAVRPLRTAGSNGRRSQDAAGRD